MSLFLAALIALVLYAFIHIAITGRFHIARVEAFLAGYSAGYDAAKAEDGVVGDAHRAAQIQAAKEGRQ